LREKEGAGRTPQQYLLNPAIQVRRRSDGPSNELAALLYAVVPPAATTVHDIPGPAPPFVPPPEGEGAGDGTGDGPAAENLTAERMEELVENTTAVRALLDVCQNLRHVPGRRITSIAQPEIRV
jgi:hypothetical protein